MCLSKAKKAVDRILLQAMYVASLMHPLLQFVDSLMSKLVMRTFFLFNLSPCDHKELSSSILYLSRGNWRCFLHILRARCRSILSTFSVKNLHFQSASRSPPFHDALGLSHACEVAELVEKAETLIEVGFESVSFAPQKLEGSSIIILE